MLDSRVARSSVFAALLAAATFASVAQAERCVLPAGEVVSYWSSSSPAAGDRRCNWDGGSPKCHLKGWLFAPPDAKANRPAIVYVHGSGESKDQQALCEMTRYFVRQGYVVFAPYLRGVADSTHGGGFKSTGMYITDWVDALPPSAGDRANLTLDYMEKEVGDLQDAFAALLAQPVAHGSGKLVDPGKVALAGHSFGGALVLLACSMDLQPTPAAVVDMSGGVRSWNSSPAWNDRLSEHAAHHKMPVFFFQTTNESPDKIIDSTVAPFTSANGHGSGGSEMAIFSAVPDLKTSASCKADTEVSECAHLTFVEDPVQVMRWAPQVRDFLVHYGIE